MTKKEKEYIKCTLQDKKEEIKKCLEHYTKEGDIHDAAYFKGQLALIIELQREYFH